LISKRRLIHLAGFILAAVALVYFGQTFLRYWRQASDALLDTRALIGGSVSLGLGVAGYYLSAFAWIRICRALGLSIAPKTAIHIYFVSQFGKYLPGNIAQHAGRLAMGVRRKLPSSVIATSQIIEILLIISTLGALALVTGWSYLETLQIDVFNMRPAYVMAAIIFCLILVLLAILAIRRFERLHRLYKMLFHCFSTRENLLSLLSAVALIAGNAMAASLALYTIMVAIDGHHQSILMACCVYTVSWLAGFITPGAPAGLGVREAAMLTLLSQTMAGIEATAIILMFRLTTTLTDSLIFGIGVCLRPATQPHINR